MSLESSEKGLTTALERLSITNKMTTPINNENVVTILTQNVFDAIDFIRLKPLRPSPGRREKINLNFYFHTSLWRLKRFYEGRP